MAIDIKQIKKRYAIMDDERLVHIAKFEIASLEPGVQSVVIDEIKQRGLDENLLLGIEAQSKELSEEDLLELLDKVIGLDCPICGESNRGLVGSILRKVNSYILFTKYEVNQLIACSACVEAERKKQLIDNCLFGWWGIPWGLLYRTPQAIIGHFRDNKRKERINENVLVNFAIQNVGELRTNWEKEDELVGFIRRQNNLKLRIKTT